jgi:hypothetical protein
MENKLGCCGLNCEECPVFIATLKNDKELKAKSAKEWSTIYADYLVKSLEPEDINCEGCHSENAFVGCKTCEIKKCCGEKGFRTCASCNEYSSCGMLNGFFAFPHQQAKENLDALRNANHV